jgi:DNA modification methylase
MSEIEILCGDNRTILAGLAADRRQYKLIAGSPPYNLGRSPSAQEHPGSDKGSIFPGGLAYDTYADDLPEWEYQDQQVETLNMLADVLHPNGVLVYNHTDRIWDAETIDPLTWIARSKLVLLQRLVWDQTRTHNHGARYCSPTHEWLFLLTHRHWYGSLNEDVKRSGSVWRIPNVIRPKEQKTHPCPWPSRLAERIVLLASREGDWILDPWAGTGTLGAAAKKYNRNATLIDCSPAYCAAMERTLATAYQPALLEF